MWAPKDSDLKYVKMCVLKRYIKKLYNEKEQENTIVLSWLIQSNVSYYRSASKIMLFRLFNISSNQGA